MQEQNRHSTLIFKYLSGEIDKAEKKQLFYWLEEDIENQNIFNEYKKV